MKTNLIFFFRHLLRKKSSTFINLLGLTITFTICIQVFIYASWELSFDKNTPNNERIFRLVKGNVPIFSQGYDERLASKISGIEQHTELWSLKPTFSYQDKRFHERDIYYTDSSFLKIFPQEIIKGNLNDFLIDPYTIVLSESLSKKLFDNEDPIGKIIKSDNETSLKVVGVIKDPIKNSSIIPNALIPLESLRSTWKGIFNNPNSNVMNIFFKLSPNVDLENVNDQLLQFVKEDVFTQEYVTNIELHLQPLNKLHLDASKMKYDFIKGGNYEYLMTLILITIITLLVAIFNYINLNTARTSLRGKEVGLKKVFGVNKSKLTTQFIIEAIVLSSFAMLIALLISEFAFSSVSTIFNTEISFSVIPTINLISFCISLVLISGLLSGIYPAFVLSKFSPAKVLKTKFIASTSNNQSFRLRQILLGIQFLVSIGLVATSIIMYSQANYISNKNIGIDTEHIIVLGNHMRKEFEQGHKTLKATLENNPKVSFVTSSNQLPSETPWCQKDYLENYGGKEVNGYANLISVEDDFFYKMKTKIIEGKIFDHKFTKGNENICVINETLYKKLGKECIGKNIKCFWDTDKRTIVGVVDDIHYSSLHNKIKPAIYYIKRTGGLAHYKYTYVKFNPGNIKEHIALLETEWNKIHPDWTLGYHILDDAIAQLYENDMRSITLVSILSVIAVLISFMGLLGLILFTLEVKTKEIGIRVIHGAKIQSLIRVISKEFIGLIIIAWIIAIPVTYYLCNLWLGNFSYHTQISSWPFIIAGLSILLICIITIIHQVNITIKQNPIKALASE
ncbi:MAG: ABC transporter permease [Hyphomicrobiales bacterium]